MSKDDTPHATLDVEVERFISKMDSLYKEKPAGYFAYLATCGSAMKLADFTSIANQIDKSQHGE